MKIKEDHIIAVLITLIIIVIWSKFTRTSFYPPGQAGSFATQPTILSVGQDIKIASWTGASYNTITGEGSSPANGIAAVTATATDLKLGPGDLNRQGWALTSMTFGNVNGTNICKFAGFRKQLQAGGGGQVWYCFTSNGTFPPSGSDFQQNVNSPPFLTVSNLTIPQFVFYQASSMSPFLDGGCTYKVTNAGVCSVTTCTAGGGTTVQTLMLTKVPTGLSKCYGPDGTTDLAALPSNGDPSTNALAATGSVANRTLTATGATSSNTSSTVLSGGGVFSNTASVAAGSETKCYWAAPCVAPGCSGLSAGFIQNSGTVMTIAGNGTTSGFSTAGVTVFGIDGVGTAGNASFVGAAIPSPNYIACGGSTSTASNIFTSNSLATASTTLILRSMWKTADTPPLWQVSNTNVTVTAGCTVSGIAVDQQSGSSCCVYIADSANSKIYKFTNGTWNSPTAVWTLNSVKGIYLDTITAAGTFLYAANSPTGGTGNVFAIPVGTATGTITSSVCSAYTGLSSPKEVTVFGATPFGWNGTCYFTNGGTTLSSFTIPGVTIGTYSVNVKQITTSLNATTGQLFSDPNNQTIYIANNGNNTISKIDTVGNILTFVGGGAASPGNTSGNIDSAQSTTTAGQAGGGALFNSPNGLCLSPDKFTMFVADTGNHNIRQIT